jgi:hypothetical protein
VMLIIMNTFACGEQIDQRCWTSEQLCFTLRKRNLALYLG